MTRPVRLRRRYNQISKPSSPSQPPVQTAPIGHRREGVRLSQNDKENHVMDPFKASPYAGLSAPSVRRALAATARRSKQELQPSAKISASAPSRTGAKLQVEFYRAVALAYAGLLLIALLAVFLSDSIPF
jgi:hypothetical protein